MDSKEHYVCEGGCGGVSDKEGACQAPNCADYEDPLVKCDCTDGKHHRTDQDFAASKDEDK